MKTIRFLAAVALTLLVLISGCDNSSGNRAPPPPSDLAWDEGNWDEVEWQ